MVVVGVKNKNMQKSATVAVINSDKKILILRRGKSAPWMPGRYCLPGGKVEFNEELKDCAARELYEETGIKLSNQELTPINIKYSDKYSKVVWFAYSNNDVALNWEHDDYLWVNFSEFLNLESVPGLKTTIKTLVKNNLVVQE